MAPPCHVPPLPPKLRRKPQPCDVGISKVYANVAELASDLAVWHAEKAERTEQVKVRRQAKEKVREQRRDRSNRKRDGHFETDSERRVRQRKENQSQSTTHNRREAERRLAAGKQLTGVSPHALYADVLVVLTSALSVSHSLPLPGTWREQLLRRQLRQ